MPEVLAEPVALQLSTPLKVAPEVKDPCDVTLNEDVADGEKLPVGQAELVPQGEAVAERDHVLEKVELADSEGGAVAELENENTELLVGMAENETPMVPVTVVDAVDVGHSDTVEEGERVGEGEGDAVPEEVAVKKRLEGEGVPSPDGDSEKLPVTVTVAPSQPVELTVAEAELLSLGVPETVATEVKVTVSDTTGVLLMEGLVREVAQAELVAEADRVRTPTEAEGQREGVPVTERVENPLTLLLLGGEPDTEGLPVSEAEASGENVMDDVVEEEAVEVMDGESEDVAEGDAVPVRMAVREGGAVTVSVEDGEAVEEAEPDEVRGPVDVADALSDRRPEADSAASRVCVVVDDGEMDTTVPDAVEDRVATAVSVERAVPVPTADSEGLWEADMEGEPEGVVDAVFAAVRDTVGVDDTVDEDDCRPVLVVVAVLEGEPVGDTVRTGEVVGVVEFVAALEKVGAPEVVAAEEGEAVEDLERALVVLDVIDGEALGDSVPLAEAVEDAEPDSVPVTDADPVTLMVVFTVAVPTVEALFALENVAESETLPDTEKDTTGEGVSRLVIVRERVAGAVKVRHEVDDGVLVDAAVRDAIGELDTSTVRECERSALAESKMEALTVLEIETVLHPVPVATPVDELVPVEVAAREGRDVTDDAPVYEGRLLAEGDPEGVLEVTGDAEEEEEAVELLPGVTVTPLHGVPDAVRSEVPVNAAEGESV